MAENRNLDTESRVVRSLFRKAKEQKQQVKTCGGLKDVRAGSFARVGKEKKADKSRRLGEITLSGKVVSKANAGGPGQSTNGKPRLNPGRGVYGCLRGRTAQASPKKVRRLRGRKRRTGGVIVVGKKKTIPTRTRLGFW